MLDENIKFKGVKISDGEWVSGYYVQDSDSNDFIVEPSSNPQNATLLISHHVLSWTLCTSYGDKDKTGQPIYTNDILQGFMYQAGNRDKMMGAKFVYGADKKLIPITHTPWYYNTVPEFNECQIIGNKND